ncbi:hypothetical protein GCM10009789_87750 [Kribbella sancticallisti]|uniref:Uncharacterized protein n=2 Tax=Kribbella sancticallisti TaxID=460087 RepID=A0ABP4QX57_9ACTN
MPALATVRKIMLSPNTSDADALRAAQMILNRTGFSERFGLDLIAQQKTDDAWAPIMADLQSQWGELTAEQKRDALAGGGEFAQLMGQTDRLQQQLTSSGDEWGWGEEPAVHQGEDLDQLNNAALRNANRDQADKASRILRDDDDVVRGTVLQTTDIRQGAYSPVRWRKEGLDEESELDPTPTRNGRTPGKARTIRERVAEGVEETERRTRGRRR